MTSRWLPRLWMVLAAVAVVAMVSAIGGLSLVRFYDDQLVRQTEAELLAQGAVLSEVVAAELVRRLDDPSRYGVIATSPRPRAADPRLTPLVPMLRANDPVLPAPPPAPPASGPAEPAALAAGLAVTPLLDEVSRTTLAGLRLVDVNGVVVASTEKDTLGRSLESRVEFQRALTGEAVSLLRERQPDANDWTLEGLSRSNAIRVVVALPVVRDGRVWAVLLLLRTPMTLAKAVYGDRKNLGATIIVLLGVVALVVLGLSIVIVRPVRALVRQTRAIARGDGDGARAIARPRVAELAELSTSLETMAALLDQRARYIQGFTSSVSHEFKTPLASMRGAIELLEHDFEALSPEQRRKFLFNLGADVDRLTRLVERLLLLARADIATASTATTDVGGAISRLASPRVNIVPSTDVLLARLPEDALTAALGHLVENGLKHAGDQATVTVSCARVENDAAIDVKDDGPGISEANATHIFEPFFTTARTTGGTGLGLSIALALIRAFGGTLTLVSRSPGAHFRITVPLAPAQAR
ncbi:MAG: ATP-binding protein [Myxococcaceae bacterium]|nr:ATP-binding protein [Myxococcaceae bacterium]